MRDPILSRAVPLVSLALFMAAGCASTGPTSRSPIQKWQRTELGFGMGMKDGTEITEAQWSQFLNTEVTPRFPAGLSIYDTDGQWRDPAGKIVRENSRMVEILHPGTAEDEKKIEEIRAAYVKQFNQDAVMRVDSPANVRF